MSIAWALDLAARTDSPRGDGGALGAARRDAATRPRTGRQRDGFAFASSANGRSATVSCLRPPAGLAARALVAALKRRGYTLGGGYGQFKESTFRIGHMGEVQTTDLAALLAAIEEEIAS